MEKIVFEIEIKPGEPMGYGSNFFAVLTNINHCLNKGLQPYISIKNPNYNGDVNLWDVVFEQPFGITGEEAKSLKKYGWGELGDTLFSYHGDTRLKFQDEKFISAQRKVVKEYIRPLQYLQERVSEFLKPYEGKKILGIHRRGRDHFTTGHARGQGHKLPNSYVKDVIDEHIENYDYLFVTSDEKEVYQNLKEVYPDKIIFFDTKESFGDNNLGLQCLNLSKDEKIDMIHNLMTEVFIMSKCDAILLMNSNVSHMSLLFSETEDYAFYDMHIDYH